MTTVFLSVALGEHINVNIDRAPVAAILICIHIKIYKRVTVQKRGARVACYRVAVNKTAVLRYYVKLASVGDNVRIYCDDAYLCAASACRTCALIGGVGS